MTDHHWDPPIVELSMHMTAYLCWLVARDLAAWTPERRSTLAREDAAAFALFLTEMLPPHMRTEIPDAMPVLRAS
jgi:hypothetical protein